MNFLTDWIDWEGGDCPCAGQLVIVRLRDGIETHAAAAAIDLEWRHDSAAAVGPIVSRHRRKFDIVAYRIVEA